MSNQPLYESSSDSMRKKKKTLNESLSLLAAKCGLLVLCFSFFAWLWYLAIFWGASI